MADYTIELYRLIEDNPPQGMTWNAAIKAAWESIEFEDDFENTHREKLFNDFIARYYFHEIGFEVPQLFVRELKNKMRFVYNKYNNKFVYLQELLAREIEEPTKTVVTTIWGKKTTYDISNSSNEEHSGTDSRSILTSFNGKETDTRTIEQDGTETRTVESRNIKDVTPKKGISIDTEFSQNNYADELNHNKGSDTLSFDDRKDTETTEKTFLNRNDDTSDDFTHGEIVEINGKLKDGYEELSGTDKVTTEVTKGGNLFALLEKYEKVIYNLDNEFIEEFKDLFMLVY